MSTESERFGNLAGLEINKSKKITVHRLGMCQGKTMDIEKDRRSSNSLLL